MKIINKSIIYSNTKYIAHQCNCLTKHSKGLAYHLFEAFPYANDYMTRNDQDWKNTRDKQGTISIRGNGEDKRYVINLFVQLFPGKPKFPDSKIDGYQARINFFKQCLNKVQQIENLESIAFPDHMGCNLAGGNWETYFKILEEFDQKVNADVFIYNYD